ncbi:hypothetical protein ACEQ8H_004196 [Pleosporales sp. CAS-2024a]
MPPPKTMEGGKDVYPQDTALDLANLLLLTGLEPPYILMGHSFGGIPARCFLHLNPADTVGMILLDCATELMLTLAPHLPPPELESMCTNIDYEAITHLREQCGMSQGQWNYAIEAQGRTVAAAQREANHAGATQLAHEHQFENQVMGGTPLTVLKFHATHDYQLMYDAAIANGDGTDEERHVVRGYLETFGLYHEQLQRAQCSLSTNFEYRYYPSIGHDAPIRRPSLIVEEVKRLLVRIKA